VAVATCGTALGEDHLDLLRRFSEKVVLAFDADEAGVGAALRGFERSVPGDLDLRVAVLPEGRDPADVVQEGDEALLRTAVEESIPLLQVRIDAELDKYDLDESESRTKAVEASAAVIALHPDAATRRDYARFVSRMTGADTRTIEGMIDGAIRRANANRTRKGQEVTEPEGAANPTQYRFERELLRAMLANDERLASLDVDVSLFRDPRTIEAFPVVEQLLKDLEPGDVPDLGAAFGSDESTRADLLRELAMDATPVHNPVEVLEGLQTALIDANIGNVKRALEAANRDADEQEYSELLDRLVTLEQEKRTKRAVS